MAESYFHFKDNYAKDGAALANPHDGDGASAKPAYSRHKILRDWFDSLYNNKGERAQLRRCQSVFEVVLTPGFARLARSLGMINNSAGPDDKAFVYLACAAGVIAHIKSDIADDNKSFARQMASKKPQSDKPCVSELRFAQLQQSNDLDEFYRRLIRTVKLIGGSVNIVSLTNDIFHWGKEAEQQYAQQPMNRLQVRWAADYYQ